MAEWIQASWTAISSRLAVLAQNVQNFYKFCHHSTHRSFQSQSDRPAVTIWRSSLASSIVVSLTMVIRGRVNSGFTKCHILKTCSTGTKLSKLLQILSPFNSSVLSITVWQTSSDDLKELSSILYSYLWQQSSVAEWIQASWNAISSRLAVLAQNVQNFYKFCHHSTHRSFQSQSDRPAVTIWRSSLASSIVVSLTAVIRGRVNLGFISMVMMQERSRRAFWHRLIPCSNKRNQKFH